MRARRLQLLAALAVVLTFVACTLNPQPLPPLDPDNTAAPSDAGGSFGQNDSGTLTDGEESPASDASMPGPNDGEAGTGDAGDAGDAGADDAGDGGDVSDPD